MIIKKIESKCDLKKFIEFPHELYKNDKNYVPALHIGEVQKLTAKNALFQHSDIALYLAIREEKEVGRIAAVYNKTHLDLYSDSTGFFGYFDSINDTEVAESLFDAAGKFLREKGLKQMLGPTNLTTNDSVGFLSEGFDNSAKIQMPYNYQYYNDLCLHSNFIPDLELFAYRIEGSKMTLRFRQILQRSSERLSKRGIRIRAITKSSFSSDIEQLKSVYNQCNNRNTYFMPLNEAEFAQMAKELKQVVPFDLVLFAVKDSKIVGYVVAVPDMNQALKHVKQGKLFPFGIVKLLWYRKKITDARIMILGVLPEYQGRGIDLMLYEEIRIALLKRDIPHAEASYVMASNREMNAVLNQIGAYKTKSYRMYRKNI